MTHLVHSGNVSPDHDPEVPDVATTKHPVKEAAAGGKAKPPRPRKPAAKKKIGGNSSGSGTKPK